MVVQKCAGSLLFLTSILFIHVPAVNSGTIASSNPCIGNEDECRQKIDDLLFEIACQSTANLSQCANFKGYPPGNISPAVAALTSTAASTNLALSSEQGKTSARNRAEVYETEKQFRHNGSYSPARQTLHQDIIRNYINSEGSTSGKPKIIFLGGPGGAGKTSAIQALDQVGALNRADYLILDPDEIKKLIPEYKRYIALGVDPAKAADLVHEESSSIHKKAIREALRHNKNIIVDSTLKNTKLYSSLIGEIKRTHPNYSTSIIFVDAELNTLLARVKDRYARTGQYVSDEVVREAKKAIPNSIAQLSSEVDSVIKINTDNGAVIQSIKVNGVTQTPNIPLTSAAGTDSSVALRQALSANVGQRSTQAGLTGANRGLRNFLIALTPSRAAAMNVSKLMAGGTLGVIAGIVFPANATACAEIIDQYVDHTGSDCTDRIVGVTPKFIDFLKKDFDDQMSLLKSVPGLCQHLNKTWDKVRKPLIVFENAICEPGNAGFKANGGKFYAKLGADDSVEIKNDDFPATELFKVSTIFIAKNGSVSKVCAFDRRFNKNQCELKYKTKKIQKLSTDNGSERIQNFILVPQGNTEKSEGIYRSQARTISVNAINELAPAYSQVAEIFACCVKNESTRPSAKRCGQYGIHLSAQPQPAVAPDEPAAGS